MTGPSPILLTDAPAIEGDVDARPVGFLRTYLLAFGVCLALGALSLLVADRNLAYDPWSWVIWGRELVRGGFTTAGTGSSFKPLPVAVTALFGWTGGSLPQIWLVIGRAGGLMGIFLAFRVAWRLRGPTAGLIAAAGLLTASEVAGYLIPDAMSEPICAAFCLAALDFHLSRRRVPVVVMLVGAALLRIEVTAFALAYAWWYVVRPAPPEARRRRWALTGATVIGVLACWILPDWISTGDALRSAAAAGKQTQGGPLTTAVPFVGTWREAVDLLLVPVSVAFFAQTILDIRRWVRTRVGRPLLGPSLASLALVLLLALMTQFHLATGNIRYLLDAGAVASVVSGCAWVDLLAGLWRRRRVAFAAATTVTVLGSGTLVGVWIRQYVEPQVNDSRALNQNVAALSAVLTRAGGPQALFSCGPVGTYALQVPAVAWATGVGPGDLDYQPGAVGTVVFDKYQNPIPPGEIDRYHVVATATSGAQTWEVVTTCDRLTVTSAGGGRGSGHPTHPPAA